MKQIILTTTKIDIDNLDIKNKGTIYEYKIFNKLVEKQVQIGPIPAGDDAYKPDSIFAHSNNGYNLEVKSNKNPDYGQKRLHYCPNNKAWNWAKDTEITRFYDELNLREKINKNFEPIWYRKRKKIGNQYKEIEPYTEEDKKSDQKNFEQSNLRLPTDALFLYYKERDTYYIQIEGSGFYHLDSDVANLGTSQFDGEVTFRFRAKYHGQGAPPHRIQFMGVIKLGRPSAKSEYNIENSTNQVFPSIKP